MSHRYLSVIFQGKCWQVTPDGKRDEVRRWGHTNHSSVELLLNTKCSNVFFPEQSHLGLPSFKDGIP